MKGRVPDDVIAARKALEAGAREAAGDWIFNLRHWDLYFTLTYDQRRDYSTAPSMWASKRHIVKWLGEVDEAFGRSVPAVASLEWQRNGWPHWHGLLSADGVSKSEFTAASELWYKAYGFAKFTEVPDMGARALMSMYVTKYITKGSAEMVFYGPLTRGSAVQLPLAARP